MSSEPNARRSIAASVTGVVFTIASIPLFFKMCYLAKQNIDAGLLYNKQFCGSLNQTNDFFQLYNCPQHEVNYTYDLDEESLSCNSLGDSICSARESIPYYSISALALIILGGLIVICCMPGRWCESRTKQENGDNDNQENQQLLPVSNKETLSLFRSADTFFSQGKGDSKSSDKQQQGNINGSPSQRYGSVTN